MLLFWCHHACQPYCSLQTHPMSSFLGKNMVCAQRLICDMSGCRWGCLMICALVNSFDTLLTSWDASWPSCPMCLPLCPLSISLHPSLFHSLERHNPDFKNELLPISPHLLPASLSLSLSLFLPHTLFLLVKTESILESENRLSVSAPLRSLLDKGIQSPLLLLHISAFLESFTQPSTFFLFFFFFFLRGLFKGFSLFLVLVSCMISILLLFMSQGWRSCEPDAHLEEEGEQWVTIWPNHLAKQPQSGNFFTFICSFCLVFTFVNFS